MHIHEEACILKTPSFSFIYLMLHANLMRKKVGDKETIRHRQWEEGQSKLAEEATENDDPMVEHACYYFLGDKKIFEGSGIDENLAS